MMKAHLADELGAIASCIQFWKEALQGGIDPRQITARVQIALRNHPQNEELLSFLRALNTELLSRE